MQVPLTSVSYRLCPAPRASRLPTTLARNPLRMDVGIYRRLPPQYQPPARHTKGHTKGHVHRQARPFCSFPILHPARYLFEVCCLVFTRSFAMTVVSKPIFVATHPRSCSTAFERVREFEMACRWRVEGFITPPCPGCRPRRPCLPCPMPVYACLTKRGPNRSL
jgi:hypothetical protein